MSTENGRGYEEDLRDLPFGPLTPESYASLSSSCYDAGNTELHKIARQRGVIPGVGIKMRFLAKMAGTEVQYLPPAESLSQPSGDAPEIS